MGSNVVQDPSSSKFCGNLFSNFCVIRRKITTDFKKHLVTIVKKKHFNFKMQRLHIHIHIHITHKKTPEAKVFYVCVSVLNIDQDPSSIVLRLQLCL